MEAKPEKFRPESVTGVERRVACYERNGTERNRAEERRRRRRTPERRRARGKRRLRGWRGDEPELERWQSIDLVGFTVSFYLSLSFYISAASPASLCTGCEGASARSLFQGFDFLAFALHQRRPPRLTSYRRRPTYTSY